MGTVQDVEWIRSAFDVVVVVAVGCVIVSFVATRVSRGGHITAQIAALWPLVGVLCVVTSGVGFLVGRATPAIGLMASGFMITGTSAPVRPGRRSQVDSTSGGLTILTINVLVDNRRFGELVRDLIAEDCDVILLQEITKAHGEVLEAVLEGWPGTFFLIEPREDYSGCAIVSRHPIVTTEQLHFAGWPFLSADIDHPFGKIRWVNVHVAAPHTAADHETWMRQLETLGRFADPKMPTVLAGDFNATHQHRDFRRLLACGFEDAFDSVGRGWGATWPAGCGVAPILRLDHVLVNGAIEVIELDSFNAVGSDHRGLRAVLKERDRERTGAPSRPVPTEGTAGDVAR